MLRLRSSVAHHQAEEFGALLRDLEGVRRVVQHADEGDPTRSFVFVADVEPAIADRLLEEIDSLGIGVEDYVLSKVEVIAPQHRHHRGDSGVDGFAWVEVMGQARANSRPLARYLGLVVVTAMVLSALLKWTGLLPDGFQVEESSLSTLAHTDYSTVLIALAAGVAAMLSFETRASAAVGVAISVTTIPASAYLGVALGGGGIEHALGAAVVLAVNVSLLIVSASLTLAVQRRLPNRSGAPV